MKVIKKLPTEHKPDGSAYAAPFHKLYVSDERGKAEAIVDVTKDAVVKTLHFDRETGMPQYDPVARKVYVNLQDSNIFAVIDPATDEVIGRYPVGRCKGNHGMTLDPEHHRAFLSSEENNLMTVFDLDKHEPIAYLDMAGASGKRYFCLSRGSELSSLPRLRIPGTFANGLSSRLLASVSRTCKSQLIRRETGHRPRRR